MLAENEQVVAEDKTRHNMSSCVGNYQSLTLYGFLYFGSFLPGNDAGVDGSRYHGQER